MGTEGGVCFASHGADAALKKAGENTGNFLFQYAMWKIIKNPKVSIEFSEDIGFVRENFDLIIIPAANQVNPQWDMGAWAKFIEAVDLPVVIVGLGAQSSINGSPKLSLLPGTQRFLQVVSERSSKIGVRGEFTQEVLKYQGIENTVITGCPSNFINFNISGKYIKKRVDRLIKKENFSSLYIKGTLEPPFRKYERILFDFARNNGSKIVHQTNSILIRLIHTRRMDEDVRKYIDWERKVLAPHMTLEEYYSYIIRVGHFFSHAAHWLDESGRYDVSFGMRIHGSIAAIQGGGLGVCVAFDSRTKELVDTMKYPFILAENLSEKEKPQSIWSKIQFDPDKFDLSRYYLWENYTSILRGAGIKLDITESPTQSSLVEREVSPSR